MFRYNFLLANFGETGITSVDVDAESEEDAYDFILYRFGKFEDVEVLQCFCKGPVLDEDDIKTRKLRFV
jgi:hypothetical protein